MTLHMLFGCAQLENCLALLTASDTIMVINTDALGALNVTKAALPCKLVLLADAKSGPVSYEGLAVVDTAGWLELIRQHSHSMSWS